MPAEKRFVYVLGSVASPARHYIGLTYDVRRRLAGHNAGQNVHTRRDRPWRLIAAVEFTNQESAVAFERYLKSGSGRAFAKRHFV